MKDGTKDIPDQRKRKEKGSNVRQAELHEGNSTLSERGRVEKAGQNEEQRSPVSAALTVSQRESGLSSVGREETVTCI